MIPERNETYQIVCSKSIHYNIIHSTLEGARMRRRELEKECDGKHQIYKHTIELWVE